MTTQKAYRKMPVVVTASQWDTHADHPDVKRWLYPTVNPVTGSISCAPDAIAMDDMRHCDVPEKFRRSTCTHPMSEHGWIDTMEGGHTVCPGDFIIRGVQDELYPCKPDIFHQTYEEVTND